MGDYEKALISQAGSYLIASRTSEIFSREVYKGCEPVIWPKPVDIEPFYTPLGDLENSRTEPAVPYKKPPEKQLIRMKLWLSAEQKFKWHLSEQFLKQLNAVSSPVSFEIHGNEDRILFSIKCSPEDAHIIQASLSGKLRYCRLSPFYDDLYDDFNIGHWSRIKFYDYYPSAPYFYLLTRPEELKASTYDTIIQFLSQLRPPSMGLYQVLFKPVSFSNNWHQNIKQLTDFEYIVKQINNMGIIQKYAQQAPSGDIHNMAGKLETKAHNDKPFYATILRIMVIGSNDNQKNLESLSTVSGLYRHGGSGLNFVTDMDYREKLSTYQIKKMFELGLTHRTGFLLNSSELVGLVHIPPSDIFENISTEYDLIEPLSYEIPETAEGTIIGYARDADREVEVKIPLRTKLNHTHIIGKPDTGKSLLIKHKILDDIEKGYGVALLDPHGDLAEELLDNIPEKYIEKTIYFDPGNPDYIPIWNPLEPSPGQDIGKSADNLIGVLKSFVTGWGDRMEHILRHAIFALMHIGGTSMLDILQLLQHNSQAGQQMRELIAETVNNEATKQFWKQDILTYTPTELGPAKHKLSKFLLGGPVSQMLSQPHNIINFNKIMNNSMIFIANLANIGTELRNILGGFQLSVMHAAALSRNGIPADLRKYFFIYLDEAHRFTTDSLEDVIAETRKYKVGMTLSHQYLRQFNAPRIDALSSVGSSIIFNVDNKDAVFLSKNFKDTVKSELFNELEVGEAVVRIGTKTAKIKTKGPLENPPKSCRDKIIWHSIENYYRPALQVKKMIADRGSRHLHPFTPLTADYEKQPHQISERVYERFTEI